MEARERYDHSRLACGAELAVAVLPGRRTVAYEIRLLAGMAQEPALQAGLARVVEETLSKGTQRRTAQQISDAFDAIGAQAGSGVGRESMVFRCSCLPEYLDDALALHAEILRTPTFPEDFCAVAIDLGRQELTALEDEPGDLARKLIAPHAYGPVLGRHELGTRESLDRISRKEVIEYWQQHFGAAHLQIAVGGALDPARVSQKLESLFSGFGAPGKHTEGFAAEFSPGMRHQNKELEQEHILFCWPGVAVTNADYPVERLMLAVLGEGMSSRLFAEVREKLGLVYWVGAWDEHPRQTGRIFIGASTTPARCDQTFRTLLREVDRLAEDVSVSELDRAKVGIVAKTQTHGDITRARVGELGSDLFHFGRPVPIEEKNAKIMAVTVADVRRYLQSHPRNELCVFTLGPRALGQEGAE